MRLVEVKTEILHYIGTNFRLPQAIDLSKPVPQLQKTATKTKKRQPERQKVREGNQGKLLSRYKKNSMMNPSVRSKLLVL